MHVTTPILHVYDIRLWEVFFLLYAFIAFCYFKRKDKIVIFGVIWFFIFILPVFFLMANFSVKITMAEHWVYLSSVGFYIIAGKAIISLKRYFKNLIYFLIAVIFLIYMASTAMNNLNFRDRVVLAKRILQFNSNNKEARKDLAYTYLYRKQYGPAKEQIDKALKLTHFDEELYLLQGVYYENTGKIDLAVSSYEKILETNPLSSRAINNLAGICLDNGNLDKAEAFFKQSVKINPLSYEAYFNLAKLNYMKKDLDKAAFFYEKSLSLNPRLNEAILALAQIYNGQGDADRAINILKRAQDAGTSDVPILVMLGKLIAEEGANDKAEYYFKQALRLDPGSDEALFNLGVFYANNNQLDKAVKVWQEALNNNPDNKKIKDYMERAQQLLSVNPGLSIQ
jgi:tetratricopeptide (TPR) repeat protein